MRMSAQGEGACLPTGSGSYRVPHDVGGLSVLLVWLGEAKPHPGAALKNPPVIGELVDDPQTPAAVSAGHRAWCDCDIPLVRYLDAQSVALDVDSQPDRPHAVLDRVADQLRDQQSRVLALLDVKHGRMGVQESSSDAGRSR